MVNEAAETIANHKEDGFTHLYVSNLLGVDNYFRGNDYTKGYKRKLFGLKKCLLEKHSIEFKCFNGLGCRKLMI